MSGKKTYKGWANYETWCVNLEFFDGDGLYWRERVEELAKDAIESGDGFDAEDITYTMAQEMRESVENYIDEACGENMLVNGWATAFVLDANFHEIAAHVVEELDIWEAGWNMPGYMPDSEPAVFMDWDEARDYLVEELERAIDEQEEGEDATEYEAARDMLLTGGAANTERGLNAGRYHWFITRIQ